MILVVRRELFRIGRGRTKGSRGLNTTNFGTKVDVSERKRLQLSGGVGIFEIRPPRAERRAFTNAEPAKKFAGKKCGGVYVWLLFFFC